MASLDKIKSLRTIGGNLVITGNPALSNLTGLDRLRLVKNLDINKNNNLTSLKGLDSITTIGGNMIIENNYALNDLSSFDHPIVIEGDFSIQNNPVLSLCAVTSICDYLDNPTGMITIQSNSSGCNNPTEINAACLALTSDDLSIYENGFHLYPNPTTGIVQITGTRQHYGNIKIFDSVGDILSEQLLQNDNLVNFSEQPNGMYFIQMWVDGRLLVKKVLKQ